MPPRADTLAEQVCTTRNVHDPSPPRSAGLAASTRAGSAYASAAKTLIFAALAAERGRVLQPALARYWLMGTSMTRTLEHTSAHDREALLRVGICGGWLTAAGALVSGPLSFALVEATHPQPPWQGAETFVRSYHPIQTVPFFCGFALLSGFACLIASLHNIAPQRLRARTTTALIFTAAFAAVIAFNYIVQTTFVPGLVADYSHQHDTAITIFSMSCPGSLAWSLEMWGYALLGAATWLVAPVLQASTLERWTSWLLVANGPLSIGPALLTAWVPGWVLAPAGIASFVLWNGLVIALGILVALSLGKRTR